MSELNVGLPEFDYAQKSVGHSFLTYRPTVPIQAPTVQSSSTVDAEFYPPNAAIVPRECYFEGELSIPTSGATTYNYFHLDGQSNPILSLVWYDSQNNPIVDIPNLPYYCKTVSRANTKVEELINNVVPAASITVAGAQISAPPLCRTGFTSAMVDEGRDFDTLMTEAKTAITNLGNAQSAANIGASIATYANLIGRTKAFQRGHLVQACPDNGAVTDVVMPLSVGSLYASKCLGSDNRDAALVVRFKIPFSHIKHTLFNDPRLMNYHGTRIRVTLDRGSKMGFKIVQSANTDLFEQATLDSVSADLTVTPVLTNFRVQFAVDDSVNIGEASGPAQQVQQAIQSGVELLVPFVNSWNTSIGGTGTGRSLTYNVHGGMGKNLLRIYVAPFGTSTVGLNYGNTYNYSDDQLATFQSAVNSKNIQPNVLDLSFNEDWLHMKKLLRDSCYTSMMAYKYNWFWVDEFQGVKRSVDFEDFDSVDGGLTLEKPITYAIQNIDATVAFDTWFFAITQKSLRISPEGVRVSNN